MLSFFLLNIFFFSFLAKAKFGKLQKTRKAFGSPSTPGQKKIHYSEPSKQFYYSESRLLMDYPFEKMIGDMFLNKVSKSKGLELVWDIVALDVFFLSWLV